ncbi:aminotransferase, class III [Eremomyces bilateralis CBS 781.70]|uniref:Aminotransferase, class III n=1 Tax=Eremomyces bilateralis CBS 781.70 TaxID=1392243 RepID=A0A6G1G1D0_9PEZI|nr:aminotransferase, class III [Eremomyces bilateralis CBS 781.70]KAF1811730.1 aminotransferase, class III [Eremomyces bilateralis CBS 781.70]
MPPSNRSPTATAANGTDDPSTPSAVLHRHLHHRPLRITSSHGLYLTTSTGQRILDATSGAAVTSLGHGNPRVQSAMVAQMNQVSYCHSLFFSTTAAEDLCAELIRGTDGAMARALIVSSGSEAMEGAMKLARQYWVERGEGARRTGFVAREGSYHGVTLGALAVGGHVLRKEKFAPLLGVEVGRVGRCDAYRGMREGEGEGEYVGRLARELEEELRRVGPETVCAFVAEPVVGAATGCVPAVPGYFKAIREVCDKYGILLILDEVMCGMGRCGTLHAWQQEGIVPDIQTIGKGLGSGYSPVAGLLMNQRVVDALDRGTGAFTHGQTYQGHPIACAAALETQKILQEEKLVDNVREMGLVLEKLLKEGLEDHPHIGNIRGKGLFWGIEFVQDKATKAPFEPSEAISAGIHEKGMEEKYSISLYPGSGTADGRKGDHIMVCPPFIVTPADIEEIVRITVKVIEDFFQERAGNK